MEREIGKWMTTQRAHYHVGVWSCRGTDRIWIRPVHVQGGCEGVGQHRPEYRRTQHCRRGAHFAD